MVERKRSFETSNLEWWNERAAFHRDTPLYQKHIERLRNGGLALLPLEVSELGDLSGRQVLHTQCHIGTDTLSLARLGADVTGVDFSEVAIAWRRESFRETSVFPRDLRSGSYRRLRQSSPRLLIWSLPRMGC